ncbi:MAG: hypothetical protein E7089_08985 [Bacteroidales bacterium]|nr:hypothetical protein [Bacteroidales bacterium]
MALLNIDNLIATASRIRYADTEGENTAERVGALFVDILSEIKEVIDAEELQTLELKGLIQGTSGSSNSRLDPFKLLGYPESYESISKGYGSYEEFNDALDGLLYDANISPGNNYGYFRARVLWRDVEIKNILLSSGQRNIIQVVSGTLNVRDNTVIADDWNYRILWRQHANSTGWSTWKEYAGTSSGGGGEVSPELEAQVNENTANIAQNTSDIEKLMKKNFPLVVSVSGSPSGLQEYGNKYDFTVTWSAKIDGVSQPIEGVAIKINNGTWQTISKNAPNYVLEDVQTDTTVAVKLTVNGVDGTDSASINFAHAAYMGVVAADWVVSGTNVQSLTKQEQLSTSKSRNYTTSSALSLQRIVYAYAQTYGAISKVLDGNGFDVTDSFELKTTTIGGVAYYVYISKEATTTNAKVTVKFS